MPTKLILIRHGQTDWNLKKRYLSLTDIDLNEEGLRQAAKLRRRLRKENIHKVYSSDARRTLHFAGIAFKGIPIEEAPELREINFGVFEGLTYRKIMEKYPEIYTRWLDKPFGVVIPKGESLSDFRKRVKKALAKIISLNTDKTLAILTHAGPIKIILSDILKLKDIWKINVDLASLNVIKIKGAKAEILLLNDTSYLVNAKKIPFDADSRGFNNLRKSKFKNGF